VRDLIQSTLHRRYHIERELGRGGMGAVYLAQDLHLLRPVAIKVLPPELAMRTELRERFVRETRMAAGFSHPNIVPVHAIEDHPQLLCFVMGFIEGETLGGRVRRAGPLGASEAVRMLQEVAWALSYAHGRSVVHRDIKPDNILIERATGRSLVTDFGIARSSATGATNLTQMGEVVGTPQFMSPEQAAGEAVDGRSDLYSLGVVAFFAVTGKLPFDAESAGAVMAMHLTQPAPRVGALRPDLPQSLAAAIDRCLEKDPAKRFESGEALAAALDPLRSARREIAPAVRLFQTQSTGAARAALIVLLASLSLGGSVDGELDRVFIFLLGGAVLWGLLTQMAGRARYLLQSGFSFDETRDGMLRVLAERAEARALELADARFRRKERLRTWLMVFCGVGGFGGAAFVLRFMRVKTGPQQYMLGRPAVVILFSCAVLAGLAIAMLMMNSARAARVERQLTGIWTGPVGRLLFRVAGWRLGDAGVRGSAADSAATSGPLTLIAALPGGMRRELGGARTKIEALDGAMRALADRQRQLDDALAEAGAATPVADSSAQARRAELVQELVQARDDVIAKRARLAGALENVRIQLLRVKSGLGAAADVATELRAAEGLAGS
jgi:hypothetical protein